MNLTHQIALTMIPGFGPRLARHLLAHFGSTEDIFHASVRELAKAPGIGPILAKVIHHKEYMVRAEMECDFVEKHNIQTIWLTDSAYPQRLEACDDGPPLLYFKGNINFNDQHIVSVVGTWNSTSYGKKLCEDLIAGIKEINPIVVSGLAYGIDVIAHRAALQNNIPTIGVVAHGLDRIYPPMHRDIAEQMLHAGGLLTEFPSGTNPDRMNFPMRNRIIAGLADVTIVVEAGIKGGALITAEIANGYNRDVCAFPGAVNQPYSEGCNYLIKTNRAHLIRNADDLLYLMNWQK